MRIAVLAQSWPGERTRLSAAAAAAAVADAWRSASPDAHVMAFGIGDGGPRSADALAGVARTVGDAVVVEVDGARVLAPAGGALRWEPPALATALLGLAAHADAGPAPRVVVPVGDEPPAGDATDLWMGGLEAMRAGVRSLDLVAAVGSQRPLLGFHGMSSAVRDGREHDTAIAQAAQAQEERWSTIARQADAVAAPRMLLGPARLSDAPGTGAAGGLAYCLAAAGARLVAAGPLLASLTGAERAANEADLVVAVVPALEPRSLDEGAIPAASALAAAAGVPCVIIAPRTRIGRRDLMNAGVASAHEAAAGRDGLAAGTRRVAQTWTPS